MATISIEGIAVTFDTNGVLPLKIGDWRALQAKGFKMNDLRGRVDDGSFDIDKLSIFVVFVLGRCAPSVPGTDVAALVDQLSFSQFMSVIGQIGTSTNQAEEGAVDRPT